MKTAILFLVFNRPDTTQRVFEIIKKVKPPRLYIAADGPRLNKQDEAQKCDDVKKIVQNIDWECKVYKLFREKNLGCGLAVSQAISWFFENEDEGIILEDDIIPHMDFFAYCEELLDKYRDSNEIGIISGRNHLFGKRMSDESYYFSSIPHIWGWATWRKVWQKYNYRVTQIDFSGLSDIMRQKEFSRKTINYWHYVYLQIKNGRIDTWDYQLTLMCFYYNLLSITPNTNLVQNIGFDEDATHTVIADDKTRNYKGQSILPLIHPSEIVRNSNGDLIDNKRNVMSTFSLIKAEVKLFLLKLFK